MLSEPFITHQAVIELFQNAVKNSGSTSSFEIFKHFLQHTLCQLLQFDNPHLNNLSDQKKSNLFIHILDHSLIFMYEDDLNQFLKKEDFDLFFGDSIFLTSNLAQVFFKIHNEIIKQEKRLIKTTM